MSPDTPKSLHSADDRWAAVKKTQKRMSAPPGGEDIGALLAQSMDAYWAQREQEVQSQTERETPKVFRRAAALFRREFWSDFASASVPVALALLTYPTLRSSGVLPPVWLPWSAASLAVVILMSAWLGLIRRRRMLWLRYSMGSLAAGLLMSVAVGFYQFDLGKTSTQMTLYALQGELSDIAISSLQNKMDHGTYLTARFDASLSPPEILTVKTKIFNRRAIYRATATGFPGELVANLGPRSGQVHWRSRNQDTLRVALTSGQLKGADKNDWIVHANGHDLKLRAGNRALGFEPVLGECLVVAYNPDPENCTVLRALRLDDCFPDTTHSVGVASSTHVEPTDGPECELGEKTNKGG